MSTFTGFSSPSTFSSTTFDAQNDSFTTASFSAPGISSSSTFTTADDLFESLSDVQVLNNPTNLAINFTAPTMMGFTGATSAIDMEDIPGVLSPNQVKGLSELSHADAFSSIPLVDPLADLVARYFHRQERPTRNPALTSILLGDDYESVIPEMMRNRTWYALAVYTEQQLTMSRQRDVEGMFKLWFARIVALCRLRLYSIAQTELDKLGSLERDEFMYENHPMLFPGRKGSMVPFELRLLHTQLPATSGNLPQAIDRLYELILYCQQTASMLEHENTNEALREAIEWRDREPLLYLLVAQYLMELKDYNTACTLLKRVEEYHRMNAEILSTIGRMYLVMGDVAEAEFVFDRVATFEDASITLNLMNAGFLHTSRGEWDRARESFAEVLKREPQNKQAENNIAVALLYQGKLDEGIRQLERRMESSKHAASLSAGPILNLCTLYELRTGDSGLLRKRELLRGVSEIAGDDLPTECFKLAI